MDRPNYEQVFLDVHRCAGRIEHLKQRYHHRTDDDEALEEADDNDDEQPDKDLSSSLDGSSEDENGDETISALESDDCNKSDGDQSHIRVTQDKQYLRKLKKKLAKFIIGLLDAKPGLHYYQGFHDVCLTYMCIYGEQEGRKRLERDIDTHFSTFMQPSMRETQEFLELIPIILGLHDKSIQNFLEQTEVGTIFALSWVITWFSHVISNEKDVEMIFKHLGDVPDPHLILYLCAELVLYKKEELLELEPEMSIIHHFLSQVPRKEKLPIEDLLSKASASFERWPPVYVKQQLEKYRRDRLMMHSYNLVSNLIQSSLPMLANVLVAPRSRAALVMLVVVSAMALQYNRWFK